MNSIRDGTTTLSNSTLTTTTVTNNRAARLTRTRKREASTASICPTAENRSSLTKRMRTAIGRKLRTRQPIYPTATTTTITALPNINNWPGPASPLIAKSQYCVISISNVWGMSVFKKIIRLPTIVGFNFIVNTQ